MLATMARNWWVLLIRGLAAILFGVLVILWPTLVPGQTVLESAVALFALLFAAYAIMDGIFALMTAIQNRGQPRWWVTLLEGIIGLIAGIGAVLFPGLTALLLVYIIAFWAIFTGVMEIIAAIQLRKEIEGEFFLGLAGLASIVFGVLLVLFPGAGVFTVLWLIAAFSIVFGLILVLLAFRLRGLNTTQTTARV